MNQAYFWIFISISVLFILIKLCKKDNVTDTAMWFGDSGLGLTTN